jgi:hypothetical protein
VGDAFPFSRFCRPTLSHYISFLQNVFDVFLTVSPYLLHFQQNFIDWSTFFFDLSL